MIQPVDYHHPSVCKRKVEGFQVLGNPFRVDRLREDDRTVQFSSCTRATAISTIRPSGIWPTPHCSLPCLLRRYRWPGALKRKLGQLAPNYSTISESTRLAKTIVEKLTSSPDLSAKVVQSIREAFRRNSSPSRKPMSSCRRCAIACRSFSREKTIHDG